MAGQRIVEACDELAEFARASHEHAARRRACPLGRRKVEPRVLAEDRLLELTQLVPGLDP